MKIIFLFVLLANIFFFFWEYNSTPHSTLHANNNRPKQILLQSELPAKESESKSAIVENKKLRAFSKPNISELSSSTNQVSAEVNTNLEQTVEDSSIINQLQTDGDTDLTKREDFNNVKGIDFNEDKKVGKKLVFCYQVGPFENNIKLDEWSTKNNINKGSLQPFSKYNQNDVRYLVYFPAAIDYEISKQNVQFFIDMGITDYWLFKTGNLKGAISLGLFDKVIDALALKEKFFNMGINVEIRESYSNESALFARVLSIDDKFKQTAIMSAEQMVIECE